MALSGAGLRKRVTNAPNHVMLFLLMLLIFTIKNNMEKYFLRIMALLLVMITASGCELIGDIFQAGMALGIILVLLIIALIIWVIRRFKR